MKRKKTPAYIIIPRDINFQVTFENPNLKKIKNSNPGF
jgi:hypothetical protein